MGHPGSNKVREFDCQDIQATIVRRATQKNFKSILFTLLNNEETKAIASEVLSTKISSESQKFAKMRISLNTKSCLFAFQPLDSLLRSHLLSIKYVIVQIRLKENAPVLDDSFCKIFR